MKTKTLFLIAFICLSSYSLFSQEKGRIIYTDFEDDVFLPLYDSISIDINHDEILDCKVFHNWTDKDLHYQTLNTYANWEITSVYPNDSLPIMNHTNWDTTGFITMCWMGLEWMGEIKDFNFIFRHNINDNEYCYGWIRLGVRYGFEYEDEEEICAYRYYFYDMAYCTIPNYPLIFGQKDFMDIEENEYATTKASLFPNPVEDRLSLQLSGNASCKNVEIYGIDGRLLKSQNDNFENIDVSDLPTGLYIAKINLNNGTMFTEKVVVR